jgi:hypothetical protein
VDDQGENPLGDRCTERDSEEEDSCKNENAHAVSIGGTARKSSPDDRGPSKRVKKRSGRDASPDAVPGRDQDARADQSFDDACGGFGRDLQGVAKSVDRDKRRAAVDDLLENGPDDFGTTGGVATIQLQNASSRPGVWWCGLRGGRPNLAAIRNDAIQQIGQAQGKQIDGLVHHVAPQGASPVGLSARSVVAIGVTSEILRVPGRMRSYTRWRCPTALAPSVCRARPLPRDGQSTRGRCDSASWTNRSRAPDIVRGNYRNLGRVVIYAADSGADQISSSPRRNSELNAATTFGSNSVFSPFMMTSRASNGDIALR